MYNAESLKISLVKFTVTTITNVLGPVLVTILVTHHVPIAKFPVAKGGAVVLRRHLVPIAVTPALRKQTVSLTITVYMRSVNCLNHL